MRLSFCVLALCLLCAPYAGAAQPINKIVAVVNGEMITNYDLMAASAPALLRAGIDPKKPAHQEKMNQIQRATLEEMILDIVISQEAERLKVTVLPTEVDREVKQTKERMKLTEEEFAKQLRVQGLTNEGLRERLRKNILKNRLLSTMVGRKVVVTKEEIMRYNEEHQGSFATGKTVHFALLMYPPNADVDALSKRVQSGSGFESVVREVSVGPKAQEGGDLGELPWQDVAPLLRAQLENMKPGQISPVFNLEGFRAQVKLLTSASQQSGPATELDEQTIAQIENILREPKLQERYKEYTEQLRKRAMVDIRMQ